MGSVNAQLYYTNQFEFRVSTINTLHLRYFNLPVSVARQCNGEQEAFSCVRKCPHGFPIHSIDIISSNFIEHCTVLPRCYALLAVTPPPLFLGKLPA